MEDVFRRYKNYAGEHFSGGDFPFGGGYRATGHFYGSRAELSVKVDGTISAGTTYLHFELQERSGGTQVRCWWYNRFWKKNVEKFRKLF